MSLEEHTIKDFMRGGMKEITIRFNPDDIVKLECYCDYDPALKREKNNTVMVVRNVEVRDEGGAWVPYPSVTWLDGVENEEQLLTRVFVKRIMEEGVDIMGSSQGIPDGKLMCAAKKTGIHIETIGG